MSVKTFSKNILDSGTVSLTAGTAHADFPLARLYDRNISDIFKTSAAVTTEIHVDQAPNINSNGGFETGDFTGWTQGSSAISTAEVNSGTYSAKLAIAAGYVEGPTTPKLNVDKTKTYTIDAYFFIENYSTGWASWEYWIYDAADAPLTSGALITMNANMGWTLVTKTIGPSGSGADVIFPAGAAKILVKLKDGDAGATTLDIYIDEVSIYLADDIISIDSCIIAGGHNLYGETIDIQHSDNDIDWTNAIAQFTGDVGIMNKTLTGGAKKYWRIKITTPNIAVEITEIFLTPGYAWEADPSYPLESIEDQHNVKSITDRSGENSYLKLGDQKRIRKYNLRLMLEAQKTNLLALWDDWGGYKPFYLLDHEATLFFVELVGPLNLGGDLVGVYNADLLFREVLS